MFFRVKSIQKQKHSKLSRLKRRVSIVLFVLVLIAGAGTYLIFHTSGHTPETAALTSSDFTLDTNRGSGDLVYEVVPCSTLGKASISTNLLATSRQAYIKLGFSPHFFDAHFKFRELTSDGTAIFQICVGQGAVVTSYTSTDSSIFNLTPDTGDVAHDYTNLISTEQALTDLNACAIRANQAQDGGTASFQLDDGINGDNRIEPYLTGETYGSPGEKLSPGITSVTVFYINLENGACSKTVSGAGD